MPKYKRNSFYFLVGLLIITIAVGIVGFIFAFKETTLTKIENDFEGRYGSLQLQLTQHLSIAIEQQIQNSIDEILFISEIDNVKSNNVNLCNDFLKTHFKTKQGTFTQIDRINLNGEVICSTNNNYLTKNYDDLYIFLDEIDPSIRSPVLVTEPFESSRNYSSILFIIVPTYDNNTFTGYVSGIVNIDDIIGKFIDSDFADKNNSYLLINEIGEVLYYKYSIRDIITNNKYSVPSRSHIYHIFEEVNDGKSDFNTEASLEDKLEIQAYSPIKINDNIHWGVGINSEISGFSEIFNPLFRKLQYQVTGLLLLLLIFVIFIILILWKWNRSLNISVEEKSVQLDKQITETEKIKKKEIEQEHKVERYSEDLEKYKLAVENVSDQIMITDSAGLILYINPAVQTTSGFKKEELIGTSAEILWGTYFEDDLHNNIWKTIKDNKKKFSHEISYIKKDGEKYYGSLDIYPIMDKNENILFYVSVEADVTKAKEIDRMKTEFISLASHQLRTPLSAMKWFLEMLIDGDAGELSEEQKEYIVSINKSNERMIELVNALLNVSRIESGRIIIEPVPTNLRDLVDEILNELTTRIKQKEIKIVIDNYKKLPNINLDQKLIRNVILNLLTNAIKYSNKGGQIEIFISKKGNNIITQISDNGYGIPESQQDKVFEKFFRAGNILDKETNGTGLGLYMARSLIEASGGRIWFKSIENKGTTFWFSLPIKGSTAKKGEVTIN